MEGLQLIECIIFDSRISYLLKKNLEKQNFEVVVVVNFSKEGFHFFSREKKMMKLRSFVAVFVSLARLGE